MNAQELAQKLIDTAKGHDWDYQYADNHGEWTRGNNHRESIRNVYFQLERVDPALAVQTWNMIAPERFQYNPAKK